MGRERGEPDTTGTSHITLTWSPGRMLTVVCKDVEEEGKEEDLKIYNTGHFRGTMKTRTRSGQAIPSQEMHIRCKKMQCNIEKGLQLEGKKKREDKGKPKEM